MKIKDLVMFLLADGQFFERLDRIDDSDSRYEDPTGFDASAWHRAESGIWTSMLCNSVDLPEQGWKIHASTTPAESVKVLDIVWRYCVTRSISFKFLRSEKLLHMANGKYFPRANSGKFVTIYPRDNAELETTLAELGDLLAPFSGPYILGDVRHRDGPLYVRYGAFRQMWCQTDDDDQTPAVRTPGGDLVPDRRTPVFSPPDWVTPPDILGPDIDARLRQSGGDFPYRIDRALHFSNSGGVYLATDERTGARVVVREARPHAGLDAGGADAVERLGRERRVLESLAGLDCVPRFVDYRVVGDHHFLVEEYIEGRTMIEAVITSYPLVDFQPTEQERAAYVTWAESLVAKVEDALARVHRRGFSFGDLHPMNIIVRPDDTVALVDFEVAAPAADRRKQMMAAPGYIPPSTLAGTDADLYALECVRLTTLMPLTGLVERDPAKLTTLVDAATAELPFGARTRERILAMLGDGSTDSAGPDAAGLLSDDPARWEQGRRAVVSAILASATPERSDRLYPGDPAQFRTGGIDLETGAAGVLYALWRVGGTVPEEHVDWLAERALHVPEPRAGLYTGLHGVANVLDLLGRRETARDVLERVRSGARRPGSVDLRGGRAGVATGLLRMALRGADSDLLAEALAIASELADELVGGPAAGDAAAGDPPMSGRAGLMRGLSGVANLFLEVFEHTGDTGYLDLAESCLRRDLAHCRVRRPGTLYVLDGTRNLAYLDSGSLGLAVVASRYLRHRDNPEFAAVMTGAGNACDVPIVVQSCLFQGRAGLILGLAEIGSPADRAMMRGHVRRLGWHAVACRGGIAFPGSRLARLSMDLSTGSAGVLLAVHAARSGDGTFLPFLESASATPRTGGEVTAGANSSTA